MAGSVSKYVMWSALSISVHKQYIDVFSKHVPLKCKGILVSLLFKFFILRQFHEGCLPTSNIYNSHRDRGL